MVANLFIKSGAHISAGKTNARYSVCSSSSGRLKVISTCVSGSTMIVGGHISRFSTELVRRNANLAWQMMQGWRVI